MLDEELELLRGDLTNRSSPPSREDPASEGTSIGVFEDALREDRPVGPSGIREEEKRKRKKKKKTKRAQTDPGKALPAAGDKGPEAPSGSHLRRPLVRRARRGRRRLARAFLLLGKDHWMLRLPGDPRNLRGRKGRNPRNSYPLILVLTHLPVEKSSLRVIFSFFLMILKESQRSRATASSLATSPFPRYALTPRVL